MSGTTEETEEQVEFETESNNVINFDKARKGLDDGAAEDDNWLLKQPVGTVFLTKAKLPKGKLGGMDLDSLSKDYGATELHVMFKTPLGYVKLMHNLSGQEMFSWVYSKDFSKHNYLVEVLSPTM